MPKLEINFTAGDAVQQKLDPFTGVVKDVRIVEGSKAEYLVAYTDPETGDDDHRWFDADHLKAA